jgi:hypothetical protein
VVSKGKRAPVKAVRPEVTFTQPGVRLNKDAVDAWGKAAGLKNLTEIAEFCGFPEDSHFNRVYNGQKRPGGVFQRRLLSAPWPGPKRPSFEDFFMFEGAA